MVFRAITDTGFNLFTRTLITINLLFMIRSKSARVKNAEDQWLAVTVTAAESKLSIVLLC